MEIASKPTKKKLRLFGIFAGLFLGVLLGLLLPWLKDYSLPQWPWIIGAILWILAFLAPATLKPVYDIWMRIGFVLGWINTQTILCIVFYGLVTPMGLLMRLVTKDPMERKFDVSMQTYRLSRQSRTRSSMEKPF